MMKKMEVIVAAILTMAKAENKVLTQNVTSWSANIELKEYFGFVPTPGLAVNGELGWHQHGSGNTYSVDIDLAVILTADEPIDSSYTNQILWSIPMDDHEFSHFYEVGLFEYQRGLFSEPEKWNLIQAVCTSYKKSDYVFNQNGEKWDDLVTPRQNGYVKRGPVQDEAFWSENENARSFSDTKVVLALSRPSASDSLIFKAGSTF